MCITKFGNPSSAGDFACSAGELEIESESWSLLPKDLASMYNNVIDWARGQLRINFSRIFKVFTKLPESGENGSASILTRFRSHETVSM